MLAPKTVGDKGRLSPQTIGLYCLPVSVLSTTKAQKTCVFCLTANRFCSGGEPATLRLAPTSKNIYCSLGAPAPRPTLRPRLSNNSIKKTRVTTSGQVRPCFFPYCLVFGARLSPLRYNGVAPESGAQTSLILRATFGGKRCAPRSLYK